MPEAQEDRNAEDLSDEASPFREEKYRDEGKVAQSKELTGMVALLFSGVAIYFLASTMAGSVSEYMTEVFTLDVPMKTELSDVEFLRLKLSRFLKVMMLGIVPVAGVGFIATVVSSYLQIGAIFSLNPLEMDLNKINPLRGAKQYFSMQKVYDGIRLILRGSAVTFVTVSLLKPRIFATPRFSLMDPSGVIVEFGKVSTVVFVSLMAVLIAFAAFDLWLQKWEFGKSLRLTKQEAKEEHKEQEGDPLIRARIRAVQREMARRRMLESVKEADVVITNPTHISVAIKYDNGNMDAPKVVAKGADYLAQKIRKVASESGVPLVENVPLARTLYKTVKIGSFVPRALYQAVAEVLAYVYKLKNKTMGRQ